jgi:putative transposase
MNGRNSLSDPAEVPFERPTSKRNLELYGRCIMTSHVYMIVGTTGNPLQNIMRDLKRHTSEVLHQAILNNQTESRREWMLLMMDRAERKEVTSPNFNYGNRKVIRYSLLIIKWLIKNLNSSTTIRRKRGLLPKRRNGNTVLG